jgi:hypothetical protein
VRVVQHVLIKMSYSFSVAVWSQDFSKLLQAGIDAISASPRATVRKNPHELLSKVDLAHGGESGSL